MFNIKIPHPFSRTKLTLLNLVSMVIFSNTFATAQGLLIIEAEPAAELLTSVVQIIEPSTDSHEELSENLNDKSTAASIHKNDMTTSLLLHLKSHDHQLNDRFQQLLGDCEQINDIEDDMQPEIEDIIPEQEPTARHLNTPVVRYIVKSNTQLEMENIIPEQEPTARRLNTPVVRYAIKDDAAQAEARDIMLAKNMMVTTESTALSLTHSSIARPIIDQQTTRLLILDMYNQTIRTPK